MINIRGNREDLVIRDRIYKTNGIVLRFTKAFIELC